MALAHDPREPPPLDQSWAEYRRLVLGELERLSSRIEQTNSKMDANTNAINARVDLLQSTQISDLRIDMAAMKARSGVIGGLMGALTAVAVAIGSLLLRRG